MNEVDTVNYAGLQWMFDEVECKLADFLYEN